MAYTSKNPKFDSTILTDNAAGAVVNPASGTHKLIDRNGALFIKNNAGVETQFLTGSAASTITAKSATYAVLTNDNILTVAMTTGNSDRTVTLPAPASSTNRILYVIKVDSGTGKTIIAPNAAETINGASSYNLYNQYDFAALQCDGVNWFAIDAGFTNNQNLKDAEATRLGLKSYAHGTTYNGGNAPTITLTAGGGTLSSITVSAFFPYQIQDGTWRCKFSFHAILSSTTRTAARFAVNSMLAASVANQAIMGFPDDSGILWNAFGETGGTLLTQHSSLAATNYTFGGDIAITAKPNWAY